MSFSSIGALVAVLSCIAAKWILAWRVLEMQRSMDLDQADYRAARKELSMAANRRKFLEQEEKRMKARVLSVRRSLSSYKKSFKEFEEKQEKERATEEKQKALLKNARGSE